MSKDVTIYTDPNKLGIADFPPFVVGDDTAWNLRFNNGVAIYDPGSVSVRLGFVNGLENISYPNSFRFVDRLNNQHVGSFVVAAGVPGTLTWDETPFAIEGGNGAWMLRGRRPQSSSVRKVYVIDGGSEAATPTALNFTGPPLGAVAGTITVTDESQKVLKIDVTTRGTGYTSAPTVGFSGGGGSGAAATAIINANGEVVAIVVTAKGTGYSSTPGVTFSGGGGSGAAATATRGNSKAITAATVTNGGSTYTTLPSVWASDGSANTLASPVLEASGIAFSLKPFIRDPITQEVLKSVLCVPVWNGRYDTSGNKAFDDALLIIKPRVILSPTFTLTGAGTTSVWGGTMDPVTDFVKAMLRFRRSCTMDIQVFGAGRMLYQGALSVRAKAV